MGLASATKHGPYEVQEPLGAGGMGEVYRARDTRLGREVAIKVLPSHLSSNPNLKQRLEREAKAISCLNHPNICTLHDVGSQDGMDFLVMEHLEGETLADRLHRGALPLDEALSDQTLMAQPFNPRRLELSGEPQPIAENAGTNGGTARPLFSVPENGSLVFQSGDPSGGWNLFWFARDGKKIGSVGQAARYFAPALSPDGTRLATTIFSGLQGTGDVWIFDLERGTSTRLTFNPSLQQVPIRSADGKTVFYASSIIGPPHIYAKAADGSGSERAVLEKQRRSRNSAERFTRRTLSAIPTARSGQQPHWI